MGQQTQDTWTILETNPRGNDGRQKEQSGLDNSTDNHGLNIGHQSGENTFEITQSSNSKKHYTESHTLESGINSSSTHHINTIWDEIKKEEIGQENEDTVESDLVQTADLEQQTPVTWENINQNQNSYNPWHQETVDKVQVDLTNSEQNHHNTFQDMPNPHPWMYNQVHHSSANSNQYFAHNSSSSFSESHSRSLKEHSTNINSNSFNFNGQTNSTGSTSGSSIMSLWNKLYDIEKQTIPSHQTYDKGNQSVVQESTANVQAQHNVLDLHNTDNKQFEGFANAFDSHGLHHAFDSHNIQPLRSNTASSASTTTKPTAEAINEDDKKLPHDIGRGDIGQDDSSNEQIETIPDYNFHKTPEEIEILSLTGDTDKANKHVPHMQENNFKENERDLSVLTLNQQNRSELQDTEKHSIWQTHVSVTTTTSTTQRNNYHDMQHNENTHHNNDEQESRNMDQMEIEDQGQQNLDQQTLVHQFGDSQENQYQNTDQQLVDFGQQSENSGSDQFVAHNIGESESFHLKNKNHETEQFDQVSLSEWKPVESLNHHEHKLENGAQINKNSEEESHSGWTGIIDQMVQDANQPTEDLKQHSELTDTFGKIDDISQHEQSVQKATEELQHSQLTEPFGQPREGLNEKVHTEPTEDLQQQSQLTDTFSQPMDQNNEHPSTNDKQPEVVEELIVPKKVAAVDSPPEAEITEKPGFWKSVGGKFKDAKHTVTSWFSSS